MQGQVLRHRFPQVQPVRAWRLRRSRRGRRDSLPSLQLRLPPASRTWRGCDVGHEQHQRGEHGCRGGQPGDYTFKNPIGRRAQLLPRTPDLERFSTKKGLRKNGRTFISTSLSVTGADDGLVVPVRVFVEDINAWRCGDTYIGRGSRQLRLQPSARGNPYKVSQYGRDAAISMFRRVLDKDNDKGKFKAISASRLVCHCRPGQACHGSSYFFLKRIV